MKIKKFKISVRPVALSLATVLALALSSCTKEPLPSSEQSNKESTDFLLELIPPGAFTPAETRVMSDVEQNSIKSAAVLVFKNNILQYYKKGVDVTVTDTQGVTKSVSVSLVTSQSEGELFDIMVIGNPPTTFDFNPYKTKTKDELKAAFKVSLTKWAGKEFIMYGEALQTLIKPKTNAFKIQMLRSLACVDIGVGTYANGTWTGLSDKFTLTEVLVVNTNNQFAVIPTATTLNAGGNVKVSEPSIPTGTTVQGGTAIKYSGADITNVNYIKSTIFIAEASKDNKVTLLIGGKYRGGTTTYYRIDMSVPNAIGTGYDYLNILRNHLYRVSITDVSAAGFSSAQEALNADPINIKATLTPIVEGGAGDIIFDRNSSILTDVSSVLIYGTPDGVKSYTIATVKATFAAGVSATISGTGITTQLNLTSGTPRTISYAIPDYETEGEYTITVGKLKKVISFTVQPPIDAHFDVLPFENVASVTVENPQSWLTLSQNMKYVKNEQQASSILGRGGKAYLHFDENIATTGNPRTARALVQRNNISGTTAVILEQLNLKGMVLGYFGSKKTDGTKMLLAIETVEECFYRVYDDTSIEYNPEGIQWGFDGVITTATDKIFGKASTITLAKQNDSKIVGPYTIYHNYAARYCYDKNRGTGANGAIQDTDVVWYLPAQNQLLGAWVVNEGIAKPLDTFYWSVTQYYRVSSWNFIAVQVIMYNTAKNTPTSIRCVRDL